MSEKGCHVFPIITDAVQKEYEKCSLNSKSPDLSPNICGGVSNGKMRFLWA